MKIQLNYLIIIHAFAFQSGQLLEQDCLALYNNGFDTNGVYTISPTVHGNPIDVWCDMEEGGWTIIQRRQDGSEDFYRGWTDYVSGFGNKTGEHWLGLVRMI